METIDEVIEVLTGTIMPDDEIFDSAVYYLRKYRDEGKEPLNFPLTWEELKEMVGKPVWMETEKFGNHWYLIEDINEMKVEFVGAYHHEMVQFYRGDFNASWNAYRKEKRTS